MSSKLFVQYHTPTRKFYIKEIEDSGGFIIVTPSRNFYRESSDVVPRLGEIDVFLCSSPGWDTSGMAENYAMALLNSRASIKSFNDKYNGYNKEITLSTPKPSEESDAIKEYIKDNPPKYYYLFAGTCYYPEGGIEDYKGKFLGKKAALDHFVTLSIEDSWWHLVDPDTMQLVEASYKKDKS